MLGWLGTFHCVANRARFVLRSGNLAFDVGRLGGKVVYGFFGKHPGAVNERYRKLPQVSHAINFGIGFAQPLGDFYVGIVTLDAYLSVRAVSALLCSRYRCFPACGSASSLSPTFYNARRYNLPIADGDRRQLPRPDQSCYLSLGDTKSSGRLVDVVEDLGQLFSPSVPSSRETM